MPPLGLSSFRNSFFNEKWDVGRSRLDWEEKKMKYKIHEITRGKDMYTIIISYNLQTISDVCYLTKRLAPFLEHKIQFASRQPITETLLCVFTPRVMHFLKNLAEYEFG